ncbi:glycosyltransferase family 4 protein [Zunongwangia sp. F363]|uniref:Glycosyltransferase family 4 protein n=1 Tax=Autumnicola tepida TaxID=3075595 RepID=A0ABU3CC19_9FLAO|nr:glycosyltransferase family 4 protein [Zunongwangia sp. F363]MDT0643874.1 glycosyltransferase family 4 protein [Zunongwangia sp. F363]
MKILHLSAVRSWGGGEKHIENLCLEMAEHHPEATNIVLCRKGDLFEQSLQKQNIRHCTSPVFTNFDFRYALKIMVVCRKEDIDIIHIHDPKALALAIAADKFTNLPPFIFSKKTSFPIKNRKSTLYKYNYPKIRRILCVSEESKKVMSGIVEEFKLKQIYHGFRPQREKQLLKPEVIRKTLKIPEGKKIIGNIANHTWPKNLETFLKVAHHLIHKNDRKDVHFVQIGGFDRETPGLQKKLKELRLEEHLNFYGFLPDASSCLPAFDVLILTSKSEGLPNVIYEAAFHKIPIVSTNVGGIPEIVSHMENGLLADAFNAEKLAEQIIFMLENKETAKTFTEAAHKNLLKNFTTKQMARETLQEYKDVLNERRI